MLSFADVLKEFDEFLQTASYLEVLPCRWGYVRLFNEGDPINFYAVLCRTPQELYDTLENWCCTIKVDIGNSKSQYIEKDKQEATKDGSESTKIQHGI